jgi:hypothetical protein
MASAITFFAVVVAFGKDTGCRLAMQSAWIGNFQVIGEPVKTHGCVRLVIAVHDRVEQELAHGDLWVLADLFLAQAGNKHGSLPGVDVNEQIQRLQYGEEIPDDLFFIDDLAGGLIAGKAQELDIGARQEMDRSVAKQKNSGMSGSITPHVKETQPGELLGQAAAIGGNDFFIDRFFAVGE